MTVGCERKAKVVKIMWIESITIIKYNSIFEIAEMVYLAAGLKKNNPTHV